MTRLSTPHGDVVFVDVRDAERERAGLVDDERALCATWAPLRVATFGAGRRALRAALADVMPALSSSVRDPIGRDARGAPVLPSTVPAHVRVSITHKNERAAALVLADAPDDTHVGIDLELDEPTRADIARHVLTTTEIEALAREALDVDARRRAVLVRFSLKESLYKALDPFVQRYVGFLEVEAWPHDDGSARFTLSLRHGEGPFAAEGTWRVVDGAVVTTARVQRLRVQGLNGDVQGPS